MNKITIHKGDGYVQDNQGVVYRQGVKVTREQYEHLQGAVEAEIAQKLPRKSEYVYTVGYKTFLQPLTLHNNSICFLNRTQTRFCNLFLKLELKEGYNTYLQVAK